SRGATVDPSPAFQSRASGRTVLVAAATVDNERQNQPSLPRLEMDAIIVPALKSRAKLTRSLPRPGKDGCVIFSNAIKAGLSTRGRCGDREDGCCIYFSKTIKAGLSSHGRCRDREIRTHKSRRRSCCRANQALQSPPPEYFRAR